MITTIVFAVVALIIGAFGGYSVGKENGYNEGWKTAKGLTTPVAPATAAVTTPRKVAVKPARVAPKTQKGRRTAARKGR